MKKGNKNMNRSTPCFGIGPMSKEIINAVYSYSHKFKESLMLIASQNQVDYIQGYVLTTTEFSTYCSSLKKLYPKSNVWLCRDHCGPGFNGEFNLKDTYETIHTDINCGFNLIHIDFSKINSNEKTLLKESKRAIEYAFILNPKIKIEIGTDENTGTKLRSIKSLDNVMNFFTSFFKPTFFVCQTGSLIKELSQIGIFNEKYLSQVKSINNKYKLALKEHNADYLDNKEIRRRKGYISAVNVAPQFGVIQTLYTITKASIYGIGCKNYLEICYKSNKWRKWLYKSTPKDKYKCSIIAGHYNFNTVEYKTIVDRLQKHENFLGNLETEIHKLIDVYVKNLSDEISFIRK